MSRSTRSDIYPVSVCRLACKPAMLKHTLFIWVNCFSEFVSKSERMKKTAGERTKDSSVGSVWVPLVSALHGRCFSSAAVAVHEFGQLWPRTCWCNSRGECWGSSAPPWPILALTSLPDLQTVVLFLLHFDFLLFFPQLNDMLRSSLLFIPSSLIHCSIFCDLLP